METPEIRLPSVFVIPLMHFLVGVCLFISLLIDQRNLIVLALIVLGITVGARMWSRLSLSGIKYTSMVDKNRLFPGESFALNISAENTKFLPAWLQMSVPVNSALSPTFEEVSFTGECGLLWYQRARFTWGLVARHRGIYRLGAAHMKVGDFLGFFPKQKETASDLHVIVYPRRVALKHFSLPKRDFFGVPGGKSPVQDPIYILGTRDYQHWRPARHIHWKASARYNRLQEKVFEPSEQEKVLFAVEVSAFQKANASERFEDTLEVVGSLAFQFHQRGCGLGIVTNGAVEDGPATLPMGRGPQQLSAILEILARLKMRTKEPLAETVHRTSGLLWNMSCIHFAHEQDEATPATTRYFSNRRIPVIFVVSDGVAPREENGQPLEGKIYHLDELRIEETQKP
jgi:uncharacterized protein (DUF58 family)